MNSINVSLLCAMVTASVMIHAGAQPNNANAYALMTARDVQNNTLSNVTITDNAGQTVPVAGIFIPNFTASENNTCSSCIDSYGSNSLGGTVISPVTFASGQKLSIGQNYLYNMIYNLISSYNTSGSGGTLACSLPGCSWPRDTLVTWCININIISQHSSYTYNHGYVKSPYPPANAPAYSADGSASAYNYNYDLIDPNTLGTTPGLCLGPVTCNDKTLTCKVSTPQNESFESYITSSGIATRRE